MDRFILNYHGNKYQETKKYLKDEITTSNYDVIAEPFCGIFGFSRAYYLFNQNKETKFYLNDINKDIIDFYKELKEDFDKALKPIEDFMNSKKYIDYDKDNITKIIPKDDYLLKYLFKATYGMSLKQRGVSKLKNFKLMKNKYQEFFKRCEFFNYDAQDFVEILKKEQDKKILIYYDPPYFSSSNQTYINNNNNEIYQDNTTMYINILKNYQELNISQLFVMNKLDVINYLFKDYKFNEYKETYGLTKNKKYHIVYYKKVD